MIDICIYNSCNDMKAKFHKAILEIITTGHWVTDQVGMALKEFGITEPQFNVLRILRGAKGEPLSVHTILGRMLRRSSNITRIVDKLLKKGFVERKECPENRRKVDITITTRGLEALLKMDEKIETLQKPIMGNLNEEELDSLEKLLIKLKSNY